MSGAQIDMSAVSVQLSGRPVIDHLSLTIKRSEILTVLGPSGCGKSTLLRTLAGLQPVSAGTISFNGRAVQGPSKERAMVFQEDALLPWRNVLANVELPLRLQGISRAESRARSEEILEQVGLERAGTLLPRQLSGGMRQRVQIARTLVSKPGVVLMDEPFSALDAHTRQSVQRVLIEAWTLQQPTIVFVTHDVDEAMSLGHRLLVLSKSPATPQLLTELRVAGTGDGFTEGKKGAIRDAVFKILRTGDELD